MMSERGAITAAEVASWIAGAEPGEQAVYAWGEDFPRGAPGVVAVKKHMACGEITVVCKRSQGRRDYIMQRLRTAARATARASVGAKPNAESKAHEKIVLDALRRAAAHGQPCPSNETLADIAGCPAKTISYIIHHRLAKAKVIHVAMVGRLRRRQVTILSSGAKTGLADA